MKLIWSVGKGYVARNKTSFKLQGVSALLELAVRKVTADNGCDSMKHLLKEDELLWDLGLAEGLSLRAKYR
jgi:hypothetical protein